MSPGESQDIESATTNIQSQPDNKTRRYDRQLRLWAATGQAALESSRILVLSASATATSILKNLVLPGIGHFTILDPHTATPADAGVNFFLDGHASVGRPRAEEAVRLLAELNDGVEGRARVADPADVLNNDPAFFSAFSLVIAHNLRADALARLAALLWADPARAPLVVVRSAGFLAEFYIQYHEHDVIESHAETAPSLRIDKPFPELLEYATSLDFDGMDPTDHGHIPYVVILVRALDAWKKSHDGLPPQSSAEKQAFKRSVLAMKTKPDEENFDEAAAQAYRAWTETTVPADTAALLRAPGLAALTPAAPVFQHLLSALRQFALQPPHVLPLAAALPDMKADTAGYVRLQRLYKARAEHERAVFRGLVQIPVDDALVERFVRNAHALRALRGRRWGELDRDPVALANAAAASPRETATHIALSALEAHTAAQPDAPPTVEALRAHALAIAGDVALPPKELEDALGEIARAPTADLPNVAAFVGGLVAQEAIKMVTKQYVPINGYCVVDLVDTWTGVIGP
ncbi:hypothetical protein HETIRDRAFT_436723 [Heterobasidion irregulare TC 32-1]|uniref:NEDD8-activating enzyme E1 regulatory subunit n=1 Tax=Heterobasidion irregulare (strain TC 32-1) TaxID=747525 RepID=W4JQC1_HETIT|nr:uncharacterized protein HETIRDRAFT_436723 [Heterobasidion irregulare TC 32-1]ETW75674.1 hypothetical protein HETIRDRAFT_436723 [Heterobasidion irregulare TC 32-1]